MKTTAPLAFLTVVLCCTSGARAVDFDIVVIADLNTPIPGGSGNFTSFGGLSLAAGNVTFEGFGSSQTGIYTDIGALNVVADKNTPIPGGSGNFTSFGSSSLDNGDAAFRGTGSGQDGIYTDIGGLSVVADLNTPIPGGTGNFIFFDNPSLDGGNVVFRGVGSGGQQGIYVRILEHHWDGGTSGLWDDADNWRFAATPGQNVPSLIDPDNGVIITGPSGITQIHSLTIGAQQSGVAELRLEPGGQLTVDLTLDVQAAGKLRVDGVANVVGGVTNTGEVELVPGAQMNGGVLGNSGVVRGDGTIGNVLQNLVGGEVRAADGQRLLFSGAGNTSAGTIEVTDGEIELTADLANSGELQNIGGTVRIGGAATNAASTGLIAGRDATLRFDGGLTNDGSLALSFGTFDVFGDVTNSATGVIAVAGNSQATFYDDVANSGVLNVVAGSTVVVFGDLTGNGNIGGGDVEALGDLVPGASPGLMDFGGDLLLGPLSTLEAELQSTVPGSGFDQVNVAGNATLTGTLDVQLIGGFTPTAGDMFEIITAASILGTFATESLPALTGSLEWFVNYSATSVELVSTFAGDFDFDGDVDGADFLEWQQGLGTIYDATDLDAWEANYGAVAPLSETSAAVPEPTTCALALAALCLAMSRRRCH